MLQLKKLLERKKINRANTAATLAIKNKNKSKVVKLIKVMTRFGTTRQLERNNNFMKKTKIQMRKKKNKKQPIQIKSLQGQLL